MRSLLLIPLALALTTAAAWGILRSLTGHAPTTELLLAAGIATIASELALLPMMLSLSTTPGAVSQASLVGTLVHMFFSIALAGAVYMLHLVPNRTMFLYLLTALYGISLVLLVMASVRTIRRAQTPRKPEH